MILGNVSNLISVLWYGLAGSYGWALTARLVGGLLNAVIGAGKAIIGEGVAPADQTTAFSLFSLMPFLLPCALTAALSAMATVATAGWLQETLPGRQRGAAGAGAYEQVPASADGGCARGSAAGGGAAADSPASTLEMVAQQRNLGAAGQQARDWTEELEGGADVEAGERGGLLLAKQPVPRAERRGHLRALRCDSARMEHPYGGPAAKGPPPEEAAALSPGQGETWPAAEEAAGDEGGHLLSPGSASEWGANHVHLARAQQRQQQRQQQSGSQEGIGSSYPGADESPRHQQLHHPPARGSGAAAATSTRDLCCVRGAAPPQQRTLREWQHAGEEAEEHERQRRQELEQQEEAPWFRQCAVVQCLAGYALIAFLFSMVEELVPIYASAPLPEGGLGLSTTQLAPPLAFSGVVLMAWSLVGYPWLARAVGTMRSCRVGLWHVIPVVLALPAVSLVAARPTATQAALFLVLGMKSVAGTNTLASFVRAAAPALGGLSWAWALEIAGGTGFQQFLPFGAAALVAVAADLIYWRLRLEEPLEEPLGSSDAAPAAVAAD
eukprot:scaffold12.g8220.t1